MLKSRQVLSRDTAEDIVRRYARCHSAAQTSYATVRDYCDSVDHLPQITRLDGDLKNVQRPWAIKALLGTVPPPARLLEIGGGEPHVSSFLTDLGYKVTLIDPYDGSGNGPTDFDRYRARFPDVKIIRAHFAPGIPQLDGQRFDAIFSISVLEHFTSAQMASCFAAIREFLRPGGVSLHCFDFILQGIGQAYHPANAQRILECQTALSGGPVEDVSALIERIRSDVDTFYLSPQGHHYWRRGKPYDEFPFRKVVSLQTVALRPSDAALSS